MDSGVATRPIADFDAYRERLGAVRLPVRHDDAAGVRRRQARRRSAWSTPKARTSACCAPRRRWSTRASREPMLHRPRRRHRRRRIQRARPAAQARRGLRGRRTPRRPALPRLRGRSTTSSRRREGVSRAPALEEMRSRTDADRRRCWCAAARPTRCCAARSGALADHLGYVRNVIGLRDGVRTLAAMQMLILPGPALHLRHARESRPDAPSRSPR